MISLPIRIAKVSLILNCICFVLISSVIYKTFPNDIETNSINYRTPNDLQTVNPDTITATFNNSKPNPYNYALSYGYLNLSYTTSSPNRGRYSIKIQPRSLSPTNFAINIWSALPKSVKYLTIRYLLVSSSFAFITIYHYQFAPTSSISLSSTTAIIEPLLIPASNITCILFSSIVGLDITSNTNNNLQMIVSVSFDNSNRLRIKISNSQSPPNMLRYALVDIVSYDDTYMQSVWSYSFPHNSQFRDNSMPITIYSHPINIPRKQCFFAISAYRMTNNYHKLISTSFRINNKDIQHRLYSPGQAVVYKYIVFQIAIASPCNSSFPYFVDNVVGCVAACPAQTYSQSTNFLCLPCISNCISCNDDSTCNTCRSPFVYNTSTAICELICTSISYCIDCSYDYSITSYLCNICESQFYVSTPITCSPICGDGIVVLGQQSCDDNNIIDGDGCNFQCKEEQYYTCTNTSGNPSVCKLNFLWFAQWYLVKDEGSNVFQVKFNITPTGINEYLNENWNGVFSISGADATVAEVMFVQEFNLFTIKVNYNQDLTNKQILLQFTPSALTSPVFSNLSPLHFAMTTAAENNLALNHYDDSVYGLAKTFKILSYTAAVLTLFMFVGGYFGAKLIALESAAVTQISGLLLLTLSDMPPTFDALRPLSLSMGVIYLNSEYDFQPQALSSNFKALNVTILPFYNINIFSILVFVPLIVAVILKILSMTKYKNVKNYERHWKTVCCQYVFYGLVFSSYAIFTYIAIDIRFIGASSDNLLGLCLLGVLAVTIAVMCFISNKKPQYFGQFKSRFQRYNISQYFYHFQVCERMLTSFLIVFFQDVFLQTIFIAIIITVQALFIIICRPYVLQGWYRPFANKNIVILIVLLIFVSILMPASDGIAVAIPLLILVCILVCQGYSFYLMISQILQERQFQKQLKKIEEITFEQSQINKIRQFQKQMMPSDYNKSVLNPDNIKECGSISQNWQNYDHLYSFKRKNHLNVIIEQSSQESPHQIKNIYDKI